MLSTQVAEGTAKGNAWYMQTTFSGWPTLTQTSSPSRPHVFVRAIHPSGHRSDKSFDIDMYQTVM